MRSRSSTLCLCLCIVGIWLRAKPIFLFAQVGNLTVVSELSLVLRACRHWCVNLVVVAGPYSPHSMVLTWCLHALVYIFHCVLYGAASIYLHVSFTFCCQIKIMRPIISFCCNQVIISILSPRTDPSPPVNPWGKQTTETSTTSVYHCSIEPLRT